MGFSLIDLENSNDGLDLNFWHWRAIVEAIRSLRVLTDEKVDSLHEQFTGTGLTAEEARSVAAAIRAQLLPKLSASSRVRLDGSIVESPPPTGYIRDIPHNELYSTDAEALNEFIAFCERCKGFKLA